jgi:hypothetical protein
MILRLPLLGLTLNFQSAPPTRPVVVAAAGNDVKPLEELTVKYGFAPADEVAGPESSRAFLDYGSPIVLADSSHGPQRTQRQKRLWAPPALERK